MITPHAKKIWATSALALLALTGCAPTSQENTGSSPSESSTSAPAPSAETTTASATPAEEATAEATQEAVESPAAQGKKVLFTGVTLKGNDISFEILPDEAQTTLNRGTQSLGLVGAWGRLCSSMATLEQLEETGVLTASPVNSDSYVWRSLKYALAEGGRVSAAELDSAIATIGEGARAQIDGKNCIAVNTDMKWALDYDYEFVTVGQYVGTKELLATVEAR